LIDRDEFAFESTEHRDAVQQKLAEFADVYGINAQDRGESPFTKRFKHTRKQRESNALVLFVLLARMQKILGNPAEALTQYAKANSIKPSGDFEKNLYWQAQFEQADIHFSAGNKEETVATLKKIAKEGNSSRIKHAARKALGKIESGQI
jgi:hypothetical protein